MKAIKQIVTLLDGHFLSKIDIINSSDSTSRFTEFYRLAKEDKINTDEEAACHFYPEIDKRDQNYRKLKSQFKDRLINTVLFLDTNDKKATGHQNAVTEAEKLWAATIILYNRGVFNAAIEISEKLLLHCIHHELTELTVQITDKLKHMYGTVIGDKNKYTYYRDLHWEYFGYYTAELKIKDAFQPIRLNYFKSVAYNDKMFEATEEAIKSVEPYFQNCSTYIFMSFWYFLNVAKYQTIYDHKNVLQVCEEGIEHFKAKSYSASAPIAVLMNQKLISQIQLRLFEEGKITAREVLSLQGEGTHNWYKTLEQHIMLAFHTKEYEEAYRIYELARSHRSFKFLEGASFEIWLLYEAYLCLLLKVGKIKGLTLDNSILKGFKLSKFLNNVTLFSTDKKGMNIPTLIIQYVLQLTEKNHNQLVDRIEAMEQYLKRHVKSDEGVHRCNCFLKLLLALSKVHYSKKLIGSKAKSLLKEIESYHVDIMEQGNYIEIMPFEHLWEVMQPLLRP
jgi:hypothetical protein